jgi:hypothetical protein
VPDLSLLSESVDEPRLLTRSGVPAYTPFPSRALTGEPEAISEGEQVELTWRAGQNARDRRRTDLERVLDDVRREAQWLSAQLRHHEREIRRLERRLAN